MTSSTPIISVQPLDGLIDEARHVVLQGFAPGDVRLEATLHHPDGSVWQAAATYTADAQGRVDLRQQAARGDWNGIEPMGPFWATQRKQLATNEDLTEGVAPWEVTLQATGAKGETAQATVTQRFVAVGVKQRSINEEGVVGTLFTPATAGPHPAIIVLNGSGGGLPEQRAALLAAQGFNALALGYFKAPGLPAHISGTPLERFQQALSWITQRLQPARGFIAVTGQSRGGELSLLLASRFPQSVSAVIAYVPSDVVHGTLRAGRPDEARDTPVWTWQGEPLRNVWRGNPSADWTAFDHPPAPGANIRQAPAFDTVEGNADAVAAARIHVEAIQAPVMLISGTDDGFWPSTRYSDRIQKTLRDAGHRWPVQHVRGEGAGHSISFPNHPTTLIARPHPVAGVVLSGGGTAAANAHANQVSWEAARTFLAEAFAAHGGKS
jgi:dienelactone hydrolase